MLLVTKRRTGPDTKTLTQFKAADELATYTPTITTTPEVITTPLIPSSTPTPIATLTPEPTEISPIATATPEPTQIIYTPTPIATVTPASSCQLSYAVSSLIPDLVVRRISYLNENGGTDKEFNARLPWSKTMTFQLHSSYSVIVQDKTRSLVFIKVYKNGVLINQTSGCGLVKIDGVVE